MSTTSARKQLVRDSVVLARSVRIIISLCLITNSSNLILATGGAEDPKNLITIRIQRSHPLNRFVPSHAFGAALDGHEQGEIESMLSSANIREMLTAGLKPLSYRLRTELAGEAWHWNPHGKWSDPARRRGYWTSDSEPGETISVSYGYRLPRRGNTTDQANDDGYSRLDDGDENSFWKSNPYLDKLFTGEPNSRLAQWLIIDLGIAKNVNAVRVLWVAPFATKYEVQYAPLPDDVDISQRLPDTWRAFPQGRIRHGHGGDVTLRLCLKPVKTRFIRVLMTESSGTATGVSADVRDRVGYAIREFYAGSIEGGRFRDEMRHIANNGIQTPVYVSSTDPWHTEADKDPLIEQPGFDRVFQSGLTNHLPMLTPVPLFYDGQFASPEHYAALYLQFAKAIHAVAPELQLGGPSLQDIEPGDKTGVGQIGKRDWLSRFLVYLAKRGRLADYKFFSFEWYPFDDVCQPTAPQLARATDMLDNSLAQMRAIGLTRRTPTLITEYGYSAFGGRPEIDVEGALLNADIVCRFLNLGGEQAFLYGYEPNDIIDETGCSRGNNMLFMLAENGRISHRMPTYYGAQLLTQEWAEPGNGVHLIYGTTTDGPKSVSSYAVFRPDGLWSVMIINKDPKNVRKVRIKFGEETTGSNSELKGPIDVYQYSRKQYELTADKEDPYPIRNQPPAHVQEESSKSFELPPYSLTVVRASIQPGVSRTTQIQNGER
jgi:hypothetical protein